MSRRSSISTRSSRTSGSRRKSSKVQKEIADNDDNESVYSTTA